MAYSTKKTSFLENIAEMQVCFDDILLLHQVLIRCPLEDKAYVLFRIRLLIRYIRICCDYNNEY